MNLLKSIFGTDIENPADRVALWLCFMFGLAILVLVIFAAESVPAQEKSIPQKTDAETVAKAAVGDVLERKENIEVKKAAEGKLTAKIYSSPQWDANGAPLLSHDDATGKTTSKGRYVKYVPDAETAKLTVKRDKGNTAVKEYWTVPDASVSRLVWTIDSDAPQVAFKDATIHYLNSQGVEIFHTPAPVAWDSEKNPVGIAVTFDKGTLTYEIIGDKYAYPVTVDPSVIVSLGIHSKSGRVSITASDFTGITNWNAARNTTTASTADTTSLSVGGETANAYSTINRLLLRFDTSGIFAALPSNATVDSVVFRGKPANATVKVIIVAPTDSLALGYFNASMYNEFKGWTASGAYTVTAYSDSFQMGNSVDTVRVKLNTAGVAAINQTGTTQFWVLSNKDIQNNYIEGVNFTAFFFEGTTYLQTWYSVPSTGLTRTVPYNKEPNYLWKNGTSVPIWKPGS